MRPISDVLICIYRYIECITDQSNWSGLFSLVVVCSIYNLGVVSWILRWGARRNFLYRFFSSYYSILPSFTRISQTVSELLSRYYFQLKFSKGHSTIKIVGGVTGLILWISTGGVLYLYQAS